MLRRAARRAEWPAFLPDGQHFLFFATRLLVDGGRPGVYVADLATLESKRILDEDSRAEYANGHLFFAREGSLFAQPFDPARLSIAGDPLQVADHIGRMEGDQPAYAFSTSAAGTVAFSDAPSLPLSQLMWLDRTGKVVGRLGEPGRLFGFAMSADERNVVVELPPRPQEPDATLWSMDRASGALTLLTANGRAPVLERQGHRLLYQMTGTKLARRDLGANREDVIALPDGPRPWPEDFSPDGRVVLLRRDEQDTQADLWTMDPQDPSGAAPYIRTKASERQARFSPDGRWVAFTSDESGREEVYVDSFPQPGRRSRVSASGGIRPLWRPDGRELYFLSPENALMASAVSPDADRLAFSRPQPLFTIPGLASASSYRQQIAVSAKGDRLLFTMAVPEPKPAAISVILNWQPPTNK